MTALDDRSKKLRLVVYQCPIHQHFITICIDSDLGGGRRFFTGKCCVSQYAKKLKSVPLTSRRQIESFIKELNVALEMLDD
jgi:hypothetical protein